MNIEEVRRQGMDDSETGGGRFDMFEAYRFVPGFKDGQVDIYFSSFLNRWPKNESGQRLSGH